MTISLDVPKVIYRKEIDPLAKDAEGTAWWHIDWTCLNDSPTAAAKRIRHAARDLRSRA